jgi:hypothetical protein
VPSHPYCPFLESGHLLPQSSSYRANHVMIAAVKGHVMVGFVPTPASSAHKPQHIHMATPHQLRTLKYPPWFPQVKSTIRTQSRTFCSTEIVTPLEHEKLSLGTEENSARLALLGGQLLQLLSNSATSARTGIPIVELGEEVLGSRRLLDSLIR